MFLSRFRTLLFSFYCLIKIAVLLKKNILCYLSCVLFCFRMLAANLCSYHLRLRFHPQPQCIKHFCEQNAGSLLYFNFLNLKCCSWAKLALGKVRCYSRIKTQKDLFVLCKHRKFELRSRAKQTSINNK